MIRIVIATKSSAPEPEVTGTSDPIDAFETAMAQQGLVVKDTLVTNRCADSAAMII